MITMFGFVLMAGALVSLQMTPPGVDRLLRSSLLLAGFVLTTVGSIARWLIAYDKDG
ncbi:hypothetical protein AB0G15_39400 [Streptosporangium sp. NPDC023825]|uniref:hypothetical protein n=1 Tax=Streptosporangium sp. NPDC023825 TaxID=3154909 RepID=UPI0034394BE5